MRPAADECPADQYCTATGTAGLIYAGPSKTIGARGAVDCGQYSGNFKPERAGIGDISTLFGRPQRHVGAGFPRGAPCAMALVKRDGVGAGRSEPLHWQEERMREIGHFIGGKEVKGASGRQGDVFNPNTGEVQAKVAFASRSEVEAAIANAAAAQPAWAATNPQRRARVMFKFLELVQKEYDSLARLLSSEHGKTFADSKGDLQRGLEVVEFACGIPHLLKGEFSEGAGPGIDLYSVRQPLGVVAGITPFNFPAMIPLWKAAPALACGNAFILKPSERDPSVPMRLAELMIEAGLPPGVLNVVNGDKEAVDSILTDPRIQAVGFVGSSAIAEYIYATGCAHGKRVQCFGGAKNHMIVMPDADMDQAVDALIGAGYGSAGERCMAVSVAVPVGKKAADLLVGKLIPRVESLKIGPSTDDKADYGPLVTRAHLNKVKDYVDLGVKEGAKLVVDGRNFKLQGYENGNFMGGCLFDEVRPEMKIYKEEIFGPVLSVVRAKDYEEAVRLPSEHEYGNGVAIFTRDGDTARDFTNRVQVGMVGVNFAIPVPLAYHTFGGWKRSGFGDLNQHGPDSIRFYTKTKTVTARWPSGTKEGAEFVIPTMK
jgi:malonate-semialdehyde dehydrogenase (acetylating)/methylmalonate-semialdehyde dehydrogenase